ncbi:hypothetical protein Tco_0461417 [Tanacetum coccineum]
MGGKQVPRALCPTHPVHWFHRMLLSVFKDHASVQLCFDESCELAARRALKELDPSLTLAEREPEEAIG